MNKKDIIKYTELYDTEKYIFNVVGIEARKQGYLTFDDFFKICMWKSSRPKQRYIKNKETVKVITKTAFSKTDEKEKMKLLCKLNGVGIPTASAILTVVYPKRYAVIDVRCLEILNDKFQTNFKKSMTLKSWLEYLEKMRNLANNFGITPRQLDMALFAMHREKLEKENFRNLYKK